MDAVVDFILAHQRETTVVAIDGPLVITNSDGRRHCEHLVSRRFGKAHAGTHSSNLTLFPNAAGVELSRRLALHGFRHCAPPASPWVASGKWFCEVYPHPAQVVLFERERIIRYKKGSVAEKRAGLEELRSEIGRRIVGPASFRSSAGLLAFLDTDLAPLRGRSLKQHEDALDAVVCAFLAFHLWRWGWERSEMFGDLEDGYIVVPTVPLAATPP